MTYEVEKSDDAWRAELSSEEFAVLRQAATERPWTGELLDENREGVYKCKACGQELFRSTTKFDSHCGWPSFYESIRPEAVELIEDNSHGMVRTEVRCANCGSHLGHVFPDGFGSYGLVEARPAAVRVELRSAAEQLGTAGRAGVQPGAALVEQLTRPGAFGRRLAQHGVLLGVQLLAPLLIRLGHLVGRVVGHRGSS